MLTLIFTSEKTFHIIEFKSTVLFVIVVIVSTFNVTGNSWRRRQEGLANQLVQQVPPFPIKFSLSPAMK